MEDDSTFNLFNYYSGLDVMSEPLAPLTFDDNALDQIRALALERKIPHCLEQIPATYSKIEANKGDDEIVLTDNPALPIVRLWVTNRYVRVKTSWKDTGISKHYGNYAEEWIPTPMTAASSWDAVSTREKRNGVPLIFDTVKTKYLSPVRKQSDIETDLESKFGHLSNVARWTNKAWLTYPMHQNALLLATLTLDLDGVEVFPFLFKTEGGCGGFPPWGNLNTLYSYLYRYRKGKAIKPVLGLMKEAVQIRNFEIAPQEASLLAASHLVQANDKSWVDLNSKVETLIKEGYTNSDIDDLISALKEEVLPPTLLDKGIQLEPSDYTIGAAISKLRADGLIMTQLDVLVFEASLKRIRALNGNIPMKYVLEQESVRKHALKSKGFRLLQNIIAADYEGLQSSRNKIQVLPLEPSADMFSIMSRYFQIRLEEYVDFTSFFYTKSIRIFRTDDVRNHFGLTNRADFLNSLFLTERNLYTKEEPLFKKPALTEREEELNRSILEWFANFRDRSYLWTHPLPPGLGTDDARIFHQVSQTVGSRQSVHSLLYILITNDKELTVRLRHFLGQFDCHLGAIRTQDYIRMCLNAQPDDDGPKCINLLVPNGYVRLPRLILDHATLRLQINKGVVGIYFLYDLANIENALINVRQNRTSFKKTHGGFFKAKDIFDSIRDGNNLLLQTFTSLKADLAGSLHQRDLFSHRSKDLGIIGLT